MIFSRRMSKWLKSPLKKCPLCGAEIEKATLINDNRGIIIDCDKKFKPKRWIPCSERMPKPNEYVLYVWRSKNGAVSVLHGWHIENRVENAWHQSGIGMSRSNEEVTHWMPLPEPPESEVQ